MIRIEGQPILTAAQMRAAEDRAIAAGTSVQELMERAGAGVAEAVRRLAAGAPVLVLCGPGNNGGDGYVAARVLQANGVDVRVAALSEPKTEAAVNAREAWGGPVETFATFDTAPIMVDAVFGTGLSRPLTDEVKQALFRARGGRLSIAVDLPSGVDTDTGAMLGASAIVDVTLSRGATMRGALGPYDVTLALGAVKPAHLLQPSAGYCGEIRIVGLGLDVDSDDFVLSRPNLQDPSADAHKYSRGMIAVVGGAMPGATALAAEAAMRSGAGYALLLAEEMPVGAPHALVRKPWSNDVLNDARISATIIGPGLGRDDSARDKLKHAVRCPSHLIIDGDALHLLDDSDFDVFKARDGLTVLTPHAGEFTALFGEWSGSKIDAARNAAARSGAYVVFKGADTVIAAPFGHVVVSGYASPWLSTAGTGDVLTGAIAAMLSRPTGFPLYQIADGVWMHAEAARRLGGSFIADDLARELSAVRASL